MVGWTLGWTGGWALGGVVVLGGCVAVTPDDGAAETGEGESESGSAGTSAEGGASMSGGSMTSAGSMSASAGEEEEGGVEDVSSASASVSAGEEEEGGVEEGSVEEGSASASVTAGGEDTGWNEEGGEETGAEETGPAIPFACDDLVCDALSEYCYEDIFDGPSEFHCEPIPDRCADTPTCACLVPIVCPESLQACEDVDGSITIECVTG